MKFPEQEERLEQFLPKLTEMEQDMRELIVNEDPATKSRQNLANEVAGILRRHLEHKNSEVVQNLSDDLMNLIEVVCADNRENLFGVTFANRHS